MTWDPCPWLAASSFGPDASQFPVAIQASWSMHAHRHLGGSLLESTLPVQSVQAWGHSSEESQASPLLGPHISPFSI